AFELHRPRRDGLTDFKPQRRGMIPASQAAADLNGGAPEGPATGMEEVVISGVELDEHQARVTLTNVPDQPGHAARVFQGIADAGVNVDMIVQNVHAASGHTRLSFTV